MQAAMRRSILPMSTSARGTSSTVHGNTPNASPATAHKQEASGYGEDNELHSQHFLAPNEYQYHHGEDDPRSLSCSGPDEGIVVFLVQHLA